MKLKVFRAPSMPQALAQVKKHLGPNAIIVQTRSFKRGGILGLGARSWVEITARTADEKNPAPRPRSSAQRLQRIYASGLNSYLTPDDKAAPRSETGRNLLEARNTTGRIGPRGEAVTSGRNRRPAPDSPISDRFELTQPPAVGLDPLVKQEISEIRKLVENLVKEQRHLHEPQMPEQLFDLYLDLIQREVADEIGLKGQVNASD